KLTLEASRIFPLKVKVGNLSEFSHFSPLKWSWIVGVEQKVKAPATFVVKSGVITATSNFSFKLADFGITGAPIDGGKVAKEPKVVVNAEFK
ncbi:MAG: hypothetical protein J7527_06525, partial [Chitinophagaceae bacterium]|nr:hypothetical protein [Chitinophagaceae bacterium]